eukprot:gnl/TRDRNA2_/TRDRNA2_125379_c0_seq2.p1 gnl/TRDRNA2_/TRDRNA2_125379_c0~~gnl/TRDRNA2_/TRDRNA2_125379_c0_seq2.p1  ORF type:complete len:471 (-),score=76.74 gnl/TRDRNA2_/TRDRNA2_125379_c0_seq2:79-1491(-)
MMLPAAAGDTGEDAAAGDPWVSWRGEKSPRHSKGRKPSRAEKGKGSQPGSPQSKGAAASLGKGYTHAASVSPPSAPFSPGRRHMAPRAPTALRQIWELNSHFGAPVAAMTAISSPNDASVLLASGGADGLLSVHRCASASGSQPPGLEQSLLLPPAAAAKTAAAEEVSSSPLPAVTSVVTCANQLIASGDSVGRILLWDLAADVVLRSVLGGGGTEAGSAHPIVALATLGAAAGGSSSSGPVGPTSVASIDSDGSVIIWDAAIGALQRRLPTVSANQKQPVGVVAGSGSTSHIGAVRGMRFLGPATMAVLSERALTVWDLRGSKGPDLLPFQGPPAMALAAVSEKVGVADASGAVVCIDDRKWTAVWRTDLAEVDAGPAWSLTWISPALLAAGCGNGSVVCVDAANAGAPRVSFLGRGTAPVNSVCWHPFSPGSTTGGGKSASGAPHGLLLSAGGGRKSGSGTMCAWELG